MNSFAAAAAVVMWAKHSFAQAGVDFVDNPFPGRNKIQISVISTARIDTKDNIGDIKPNLYIKYKIYVFLLSPADVSIYS